MGFVYAEITLKNVADEANSRAGVIKSEMIRTATVTALVDTGARTLVINEELQQQLGLGVIGTKQATLANNKKETVKIVEPVEVHWKNRHMVCRPMVASGSGTILLGAIPLEDMDLIVDPGKEEVVGAHGDEEVVMLM